MGTTGYSTAAVSEENQENSQKDSPEASSEGATEEKVEIIDAEVEGEDEPEEEVDPLTQAQEELKTARDQLLRTAADFDNFRKRSRREVQDAEKRGREELLKEILPVFDNLERAAQHAETATEVKALADGVEMVLRLFLDTLKRSGIERVESMGKPFDPMVHEAIQQLESDEPPGTVVAEVQAGYKLGDRLVRAAMVAVAKPPATPTAGDDDESN